MENFAQKSNEEEEQGQKGPILTFLMKKFQNKKNGSIISNSSTVSTQASTTAQDMLQHSFMIPSYQVKDSVQYQVYLKENISINGRFKTRYSKLLKLHQSLKNKNIVFPSKKMFGTKSTTFIKQRMVQLEKYLNQISLKNELKFQKFVSQIKSLTTMLVLKI